MVGVVKPQASGEMVAELFHTLGSSSSVPSIIRNICAVSFIL